MYQSNIWDQLIHLSEQYPTNWQEYESQFQIKKLELEKLQSNEIRQKRADFERKYLADHQISKSWMENQYRLFIWFLFTYSKFIVLPPEFFTLDHWSIVSECFNKQPLFCQYFYWSCKKIKSTEWREDQDSIIHKLMSNGFNKKWTEIGLELFTKSGGSFFKKPKSIRERWLSHLNPIIKKEEWTLKQDLELVNLIKEKGRKWSKIAKIFGNRTEHTIKNRFNQLATKFVREEAVGKNEKDSQTDKFKLDIIYKQIMKSEKASESKNLQICPEHPASETKIEESEDPQFSTKFFNPIILSMPQIPEEDNARQVQ